MHPIDALNRPSIVISRVFGFHTNRHPAYHNLEHKNFLAHNICNALDWIPGVSTISGLARVIFSSFLLIFDLQALRLQRNTYKAELFRGIISTFNLGVLFCPFDIYFSYHPPKCIYIHR